MAYVKLCTRCGGEFVERVETCPDCGLPLIEGLEGQGSSTDALRGPAVSQRASDWAPPLPPSPDLVPVENGPLDMVQQVGAVLDEAGIRFRIEVLEAPDVSVGSRHGSMGSSGRYRISVTSGDLAHSRGLWEEEVERLTSAAAADGREGSQPPASRSDRSEGGSPPPAAPPGSRSDDPGAAPRRRSWIPLALALVLLLALLLEYGDRLRLPWSGFDTEDFTEFLADGLPESDPPLTPAARAGVEKALDQWAEGENLAAIAILRATLEPAPDSPTVHYLLAELLAMGGSEPEWKTLEHARIAAETAPGERVPQALLGDLLASAGLRGRAAVVADTLSGETPRNWREAVWMTYLFHSLDRPRDLLAATRRDAPWADEPYVETLLLAEQLWARLALGHREEARELFGTLPLDGPDRSFLLRYVDAYRASLRPEEAARGLIYRDMAVDYPLADMERIVALARDTGQIEGARRILEDWLMKRANDKEDWLIGLAWFGEERQTQILDRRLAEIPPDSSQTVPPGMVRLPLYGPEEQPEARELARRLARLKLDPEEAQWVDSYRFGATGLDEPYYVLLADLQRHVENTPGHTRCALQLVDLLATTQPAAARERLDRLRSAQAGDLLDDPWDAMDAELLEVAILLAEDEGEAALAAARTIPLGAQGNLHAALDVEQLKAEAAFVGGDEALLEEHLKSLLHSGEAAHEAAALVLLWSHRLASGRPITARRDAEALLTRHGDGEIEAAFSPSLLAILAQAGRMDRATLEERIHPENRMTPELVGILFEASEARQRDADGSSAAPLFPRHRAALEALAASQHPGRYAPLLARTILRRLPTRSTRS